MGQKTIAPIAHDGKKADMVAFATFNREKLASFNIATNIATADLIISDESL